MGHGVRNADERKCTLTIDILLQNDRKRAKQRLFKRRQGRWGVVQTNLSTRVSVVVSASSSNAPHQRRDALEKILIKIRITRILGDGAKDGDEALENLLIDGRQRLTCRDDHAHRAWSMSREKRNKEEAGTYTS